MGHKGHCSFLPNIKTGVQFPLQPCFPRAQTIVIHAPRGHSGSFGRQRVVHSLAPQQLIHSAYLLQRMFSSINTFNQYLLSVRCVKNAGLGGPAADAHGRADCRPRLKRRPSREIPPGIFSTGHLTWQSPSEVSVVPNRSCSICDRMCQLYVLSLPRGKAEVALGYEQRPLFQMQQESVQPFMEDTASAIILI